jgi:hypothetical protein
MTYVLYFDGGGEVGGDPRSHRLIIYKDTKNKCRLYWCLIEFIDWRYSQSCWYFRPSSVNYCFSNLLSGSPSPPLTPSQSQSAVYSDGVWLGEGGGVLSCVGDHILQVFNAQHLTRFRTYNIARQSRTET